jgi:signal transduction histidine kinase
LRKVAMDNLTMFQTLQSNLIHGIRAKRLVPFQTMAGTLQRQLDKGLDQIDRSIVKETLRRIQYHAQESFKDVENILELSKKNATERATLVDINVQVKDAYHYILDSKPENVHVEFHCMKNLPKIKIDPYQLSVIFENIFTNAYKALKGWDGERRVIVKTFKVTKKGNIINVGAKFHDTGPSVPKNVVMNLFDVPLAKVGVGLYTSARALALYNGKISLTENKPGRVIFNVKFDVKGEK